MMKRYLIVAMAVFLTLPVLPVSAAEKEKEDINTNIYQVELPMDTKGIFDFILDPQSLIDKTDAAAYNGRKFEHGSTLFFKRTDGKVKEDYSSASDFVTIVNKSSVPVDVSLSIKVSDAFADQITLTDDKKFKNDTDASVYLALKDGEREIPIGRDGLALDVTVDAAPDGSYEYSYDKKSEKYIYQLKKDSSGIQFDEFSFQLTGAANGKGDWTELADVVPEIEVDWKVSPREGVTERKDAVLKEEVEPETGAETEETVENAGQDTLGQQEETIEERAADEGKTEEESKAPSVGKKQYGLSAGEPMSVEVDLGAGNLAATQVASVRRKDTGEELLNAPDGAAYRDGKIQFSKEWVDQYIEDRENKPGSLIVTFDDVNTTEVEIAVKE